MKYFISKQRYLESHHEEDHGGQNQLKDGELKARTTKDFDNEADTRSRNLSANDLSIRSDSVGDQFSFPDDKRGF